MSEWSVFGMQIVLIVGVLVFAILVAHFQRQRHLAAWNELAGRMGLDCERGEYPWSPIRLTGSYRGRPLVLDTIRRGSGKNSKTYTRAALKVNNSTLPQLLISEESVFDKMGKWVGMQDVQVGDDMLDQRYKIKGQPEAEIVRLLNSGSVRQKLLDVSGLKVEVEMDEVRAERYGVEQRIEELEKIFELLDAIAEGLGRDYYRG